MTKTILVEILASFSEKERMQFKNYVYSPFFNKNKKVRQLCAHILAFAPSFEHPQLKKHYAYQLLFGEDAYQELRINNIISDLLQLLYGYLIYTQNQAAPRQQQISLLEALLERNLQRPIPRIIRRIEQLRAKESHQSIDFYREESLFYEQLNYYTLTQNKRAYDANLQYTSDRLDVYYWSHKLRNACEMLNHSAMLNVDYHSDFLDDFLDYHTTHQAKYEAYPALHVYYQAYIFLKAGNEIEYNKLSSLLTRHQVLFPDEELRILYGYMLNYGVRQVNFGKLSYYAEILKIYKILIAQNLLLQQAYLTKWSFINATTSGIRVGEYAWTEAFIAQHQVYLRESERQNTVDYQLAALYFAKGEYAKTLQFLQQIEFTDILYHVSSKLILLKVYYELDEVEAFYPLVNATNNLLRRNSKLGDYHKASYANFLKLAKKLYDLKNSRKTNVSTKLEQFGEQLSTTSPLANKGWLMEKYEILKQ